MDPTCKQCGLPVDRLGRAQGRGRPPTFCSYQCKEQHHDQARKAGTAQRLAGRVCAVCDRVFDATTGRAKCCSPKCSEKWQNDRRAAKKRAAWEARKQPCPQCGAELGSDRRAGSMYCSPECKKKALDARWRARSAGYNRQYLYGITPDEYQAMLAKQDDRCAICRADVPGGKGGWHVDHCHETKRVRGLLCHCCNIMLGQAQDDPERLEAAARYLRGG